MKYIDYVQLNPFQKLWYNLKKFFKSVPGAVARFFKAIGTGIVKFFVGIGKGFAGYGTRFVKGDWAVKISYLIFGFANMVHGQIIKGLIFLLTEVAYIAYMFAFGWGYITKFDTLGDTLPIIEKNSRGFETVIQKGDDSRLVLLYGILTIIITVAIFIIYIASTKSGYAACETKRAGKKPLTFVQEIKQLADEKFHVTLLSLPCILIGVFTILPLIFMIMIAFTNYNRQHLPPGNLFTWVGLDNFKNLLTVTDGAASKGATFVGLAQWTIIWAIFATFTNYIVGMILALMINKKGIKLKALWRTLFVVVIAVPQFVSLLVMNQMLQDNGAINLLLQQITGNPDLVVKFFNGSALTARITVIVVNMWVGVPYTILITSGILMNIPADLYESATIDGAGPVKSFMKITLPYMLFVTTPYLITQFVGNINNFNVIYLLSNGGPTTENYYQAGYTDILVTWLFKLTMSTNDYNLAATIGILVFIVCATLSLITFNMTKSAKDEEAFS